MSQLLPQERNNTMNLTTADLTKTQQQPRLLTVPEAAQELRISNWLIYELIRTKQLKTLTIATRRLVAFEDITNFINDRKEHDVEA
jgi:excisionase family DNA binding protein